MTEQDPGAAKLGKRLDIASMRFWLGLWPRDGVERSWYVFMVFQSVLRIFVMLLTGLARRAAIIVREAGVYCAMTTGFLMLPLLYNLFFGNREVYQHWVLGGVSFLEAVSQNRPAVWHTTPDVQYYGDWFLPALLLGWTLFLIQEMFVTRHVAENWGLFPLFNRGPATANVDEARTLEEALPHLLAKSALEFPDLLRGAGRLWGVRALAFANVFYRALGLCVSVMVWWGLLYLSFHGALRWWPPTWGLFDVLRYYLWQTVNAGLFELLELFGWRFEPVGDTVFWARLTQYVLVVACVGRVAESIFYAFKLDLASYRNELLRRLEAFEADETVLEIAPIAR